MSSLTVKSLLNASVCQNHGFVSACPCHRWFAPPRFRYCSATYGRANRSQVSFTGAMCSVWNGTGAGLILRPLESESIWPHELYRPALAPVKAAAANIIGHRVGQCGAACRNATTKH
jgi:hypothetical protein